MSGYLADRLNDPVGKFDGSASTEFLRERKVDEALIGVWDSVMDQCEQASFGASINGDASGLAERARDCLGRIERQRL